MNPIAREDVAILPMRDVRYRRRFLKGPLPKDYWLPYPHGLNINHLDAKRYGPQVWAGLHGWLRVVYLFCAVIAPAMALVGVMGLLLLPWNTPSNVLGPLSLPVPWAALGLLCYWGYKRRGFVPSRVVFDREHGEVIFRARRGKPERRYPFAWAQGYMGSITTRSGLQHKLLEIQIIDPATGQTLARLGGGLGPTVQAYDVLSLWSLLCRYMDRHQPLPLHMDLLDAITREEFPHYDTHITDESRDSAYKTICDLAVEMEAISVPNDYLGIEFANPFGPTHPYPENAARVLELRAEYEYTTRRVLSAIGA